MPQINEFFDINKFPKEPGIIYMALSMPLLNSSQSPENCYNSDLLLIEKILISNVGCQVVYTDSLYLYSPEEAFDLKIKHQKMFVDHKQGWMNLIRKNKFIVPSAFTFMSWSQLILDCEKFTTYLRDFKEIYQEDSTLQNYIELDIKSTGREVSKYTIGYMLEEILLDYLVVKGAVRLQNEYTKDKEEWVLNCYHGKPHRSHVYLHQQNFFKLENPKNIYENAWYDMLSKKLYTYDRLDIDSFDFTK